MNTCKYKWRCNAKTNFDFIIVSSTGIMYDSNHPHRINHPSIHSFTYIQNKPTHYRLQYHPLTHQAI